MRYVDRRLRGAPEYLAVKRLSGDEDRWIIVPVSELRIVFLGSIAIARRLLFPDCKPAAFRSHRVYVRTGAGVYLAPFRSVSECVALLGDEYLVVCFESVVVNLRYLAWLEANGKQRLAGVRVGVNNGTECVPVSRRHLRTVLRRLGVRLRRRNGPECDDMD